MEILKQEQSKTKALDRMVIELFAAKYNFLEQLNKNDVQEYLDDLYRYIKQFHNGILLKINETHDIKKDDRDYLREVIREYQKERGLKA